MRKTLMEIYDDNWRNENVSFIEALVDVIKEIESRLSALERQPSSLPSPTKVGEGMKNWNPGMGLNDKFRARAEGYREALEDVVAKFEPLIVEIEICTNTTEDVSEFAATDVIEMINQMLIAYEKGSDGWDRQCKKCGKVTHMTQEECAYALAHGWPKCCGEEMGDIAQKEAK